MAIELDEKVEKWLLEKVASGKYSSVSEAVAAGLCLMTEEEQRVERFEALKAAIDKGVKDYEEGRYEDGETVFKRLKENRARKMAQRSGTDG